MKGVECEGAYERRAEQQSFVIVGFSITMPLHRHEILLNINIIIDNLDSYCLVSIISRIKRHNEEFMYHTIINFSFCNLCL